MYSWDSEWAFRGSDGACEGSNGSLKGSDGALGSSEGALRCWALEGSDLALKGSDGALNVLNGNLGGSSEVLEGLDGASASPQEHLGPELALGGSSECIAGTHQNTFQWFKEVNVFLPNGIS